MNRHIQTRQGISLIIVLAIMLAATVMATAVYYTISRYNKRSGEDLYSATAVSAAKAGAASLQSWLTYEGQQTLSLVDAFLDTNTSKNPHRWPIEVSLGSDFLSPTNAQHQTFRVYLVDVIADSNSTSKSISLKFQINATGQDGATSVATVMYNLQGIGYQSAPPANVINTGSAYLQDALYIGGSFNHVDQTVTTNGSLYVGTDLASNGASGNLKIGGDLVLGKGISYNYNGSFVVAGNFYAGASIFMNSGSKDTVSGSAYFYAPITVVPSGSNILVMKDAWFNDAIGSGQAIQGTIEIGGNADFQKNVTIAGGNILVDHDARVAALATVSANSGGNFSILRNANIYGTINSSPLTLRIGSSSIDTGYIEHVSPTNIIGTGGAKVFNNVDSLLWVGDTSIGTIDTLKAIQDTLAKNVGKKTDPPFSSDSLVKYQIPYKTLATKISGCGGVPPEDKFGAATLNCYFKNAPASLLWNGFLAVDMSGMTFGSSVTTRTESGTTYSFGPDTLIKGNFFLNNVASNNTGFPATTSDSKVFIWPVSGASLGIAPITISGVVHDTCYCVIYNKSASSIQFLGGTVSGAVYMSNGTSMSIQNHSGTFLYNANVVSTIWSMVLPSGTPPASLPVNAPKVLAILSPRLQVSVANMIFGPTTMDSTQICMIWGNSMVAVPTFVSVTQNQYTDWADFKSKVYVNRYVKPDSAGCAFSVDYSQVNFAQPGTYNVVYSATGCHGSNPNPSAIMVVWVKPIATSGTSATGTSSYSSGASSSSVSSGASSSLASSSSVASSSSYLTMGTGFISWNRWDNVSGTLVSNVPVGTTPGSTGTWTTFENPSSNTGVSNYALQIRGYVFPPVSGSYLFYIASDDGSKLYLSTDSTVANRVAIANNGDLWNSFREFTKYTSQTSAPISLIVGHKYYIEALMKQGTLGDNLSVAWLIPGTSTTAIIDGVYLSPYVSSASSSSVAASSSGVSSSSVAASSSAVTITTWGPTTYSFPSGTTNVVMNVTIGVPSWYSATSVKFYCTVSSSGNATVTFTIGGVAYSGSSWQSAQISSVPMIGSGTVKTPNGAAVCYIGT